MNIAVPNESELCVSCVSMLACRKRPEYNTSVKIIFQIPFNTREKIHFGSQTTIFFKKVNVNCLGTKMIFYNILIKIRNLLDFKSHDKALSTNITERHITLKP